MTFNNKTPNTYLLIHSRFSFYAHGKQEIGATGTPECQMYIFPDPTHSLHNFAILI